MMLNDKRPEICPPFFQVDLAPPIWKFVYRSEGKHRSVAFIVVPL
jgi:hypothetical protein